MLRIPIFTFSAVGLDSGWRSSSFDRRSKMSRGMWRRSHDRIRSVVGTKLGPFSTRDYLRNQLTQGSLRLPPEGRQSFPCLDMGDGGRAAYEGSSLIISLKSQEECTQRPHVGMRVGWSPAASTIGHNCFGSHVFHCASMSGSLSLSPKHLFGSAKVGYHCFGTAREMRESELLTTHISFPSSQCKRTFEHLRSR